MQAYMPVHYQQLSYIASCLPYNDFMPCHPFLGTVLNTGVSTLAHRDGMDLGFCLVMPVGTWDGAWLGLYEMRLVWAPVSENLFWFLSNTVTHFNDHLAGTRCSYVFNTDSNHAQWASSSNNFNARRAY